MAHLTTSYARLYGAASPPPLRIYIYVCVYPACVYLVQGRGARAAAAAAASLEIIGDGSMGSRRGGSVATDVTRFVHVIGEGIG